MCVCVCVCCRALFSCVENSRHATVRTRDSGAGERPRAVSVNSRSERHQLFHATKLMTSMIAVMRNIGEKSRPLASSSQPVKYWPSL